MPFGHRSPIHFSGTNSPHGSVSTFVPTMALKWNSSAWVASGVKLGCNCGNSASKGNWMMTLPRKFCAPALCCVRQEGIRHYEMLPWWLWLDWLLPKIAETKVLHYNCPITNSVAEPNATRLEGAIMNNCSFVDLIKSFFTLWIFFITGGFWCRRANLYICCLSNQYEMLLAVA